MSEIAELKQILLSFIQEQKVFNEEQRDFNEEQKVFNVSIDKKIDKVQYFLEETVASQTKMFFEEQIEMKTEMREMEVEISNLKNDLSNLSLRVNLLFKA